MKKRIPSRNPDTVFNVDGRQRGERLVGMRERIVARLTEELDPSFLDVIDESDRHAGHAGARPGGGTHYRVRIVSPKFAGLSRVARHRLVYGVLPAEFAAGLHALALDAKAPGER
jgi:BolA family transcriptional regulator, general stress-responsive regulator